MTGKKLAETKPVLGCPYCQSKKIIKKGFRRKKYEKVQLHYCRQCQRKFTPLITKGRTYPLKVILDSITYYNRLCSLSTAAERVTDQYGIKVSQQNISNWLKAFAKHLPFLRLRPFIAKKYDQREVLVENRMFHGQIFDFKYHRAKTDLILEEEYRHYRFHRLRELLELVTAECPHQVFRASQKRASEYRDIFDCDQVKITPRSNTAVKNARLVMQAVADNRLRHQALQEFMIINDSVTVAAELPVLLDGEDISHYQNSLGFQLPLKWEDDQLITGHIDLVQIRNGAIHILDYKPSARKARPVDQLTIYALALSRMTGIRLFHFKCAWFDEEDYFEFFPLHVVYKKKRKRKRARKS